MDNDVSAWSDGHPKSSSKWSNIRGLPVSALSKSLWCFGLYRQNPRCREVSVHHRTSLRRCDKSSSHALTAYALSAEMVHASNAARLCRRRWLIGIHDTVFTRGFSSALEPRNCQVLSEGRVQKFIPLGTWNSRSPKLVLRNYC